MCVEFSSAEFPTPKTELVQKFQVLYLGMMPVARPIGWCDTYTQSDEMLMLILNVYLIQMFCFITFYIRHGYTEWSYRQSDRFFQQRRLDSGGPQCSRRYGHHQQRRGQTGLMLLSSYDAVTPSKVLPRFTRVKSVGNSRIFPPNVWFIVSCLRAYLIM